MRKRREGVGWTAGTGAEREEGKVSCSSEVSLGVGRNRGVWMYYRLGGHRYLGGILSDMPVKYCVLAMRFRDK